MVTRSRSAMVLAGAVWLTAASCSSQPEELSFSQGDSPVATVIQTTTTLGSVDVNVDFDRLKDAFAELEEVVPASTQIELFDRTTGDLSMTYEVSYVPGSQWRYATASWPGAQPDMQAYLDIDGNIVMSTQSVLNMGVYLEALNGLEALGGEPSEAKVAAFEGSEPGETWTQLRSDLESLDGFILNNNPDMLHSLFKVEYTPNLLVANYGIEGQIQTEGAEIRVLGETDGTVEFELVPNADEPARYYVMRLDREGRVVRLDNRLAGTTATSGIVMTIDYDLPDERINPPEHPTYDEFVAVNGEPDTWTIPLAGS